MVVMALPLVVTTAIGLSPAVKPLVLESGTQLLLASICT
jgi:hypothetical protein